MNAIRIRRKSIFSLIVAILTLGIFTPVLADYLGPSRVVTGPTSVCKVILRECQYVPSKDTWRYKPVDDWSCSNEGKPWQAYSSNPSSQGCFKATEGDTYWSKEETLEEITTTYPPATISSFLQDCTLDNTWCTTTAPVLSLRGYEPVAGYGILAIEGTLNGQTFACSGANCSVPLGQGRNVFDFWALSSWGDTSEKGSLYIKVDSQLPTITGTLSGTAGSNGWYVSPVSFNGSTSDTTSGVASFTCTLDGSALPACDSITINAAGSHTLVLTAQDYAGNRRTINQNAAIDTQAPVLTAGLSGTLGSNTWYNAVTLNASASDPTPGSGLSTFEYSQDGSGWMSFPVSGELALPEGKHSVELRVADNAGQLVTASKSFWLDSVAPQLILNPSGTLGANNWYTTNLSLSASASDGTSGMDILEYRLNGGAWAAYTAPLIFNDGTHTLTFWAQDLSGLVTQVNGTYQVDTRAPQISGSLSGVPGANGWYISDVTLSASASDPAPGSGLEAMTYTLNGASENPYTSALTLSDGEHTVQLSAQDKAGLTYATGQSIKVDTRAPTLNIQTTLPHWVNGTFTMNGTADDPLANSGQPGSGLSKVEVSTDGGQVWQTTTGNASWSYTWNTQASSSGTHAVHVRAIDNAGLTTEQTFTVGVDNDAPEISLPDSWYQWDTVTIDIWDDHSGLSEAYAEISDPEGRLPTRKIDLDLEGFPMEFKWDRRFGDGSVAPLGTYNVDVMAIDSQGHSARENASINILVSFLPAGPTSTAQPYVRPDSTPIPETTSVPTAIPLSASGLHQNAVVSEFGSTPEAIAQETAVPENIQSERATPAQTSVSDWFQSVLVPDVDTTVEEISVEASDEPTSASQSSASDTNILWGASAAAMIGAATAYALDEKRKREEEAERKRAEIEERIAEQQAKKLAEAEARKVAQWLEGQALLKEQKLQQTLHALEMADVTDQERFVAYQQSAQYLSYQARMTDWHIQQAKLKAAETADMTEEEKFAAYQATDEYKERQEALEEYQHQQRVQSADTARWEGLASQGEYAANMPEENWWEKTKSFLQEEIIEPFNTSVYVPYIEPAVEQTKDVITTGIAWANETIYTPYILPKVEEAKEKLSDDVAWINEHFYQPHVAPMLEKVKEDVSHSIAWANEHIYQPTIKPLLETTMQQVSAGIDWFNSNVYQPYLQPVVTALNEELFQPYVQPFLEKVQDKIADGTAWLNTNVYQPIFQPVVDDAQDVWAEYGEWVHGALDAAGFIPGLGEIADGLNGLIYLAEGSYIEASVSLLAMIPILGDLGKAGKLTAQVGQELLEEAAEKVVKETAEELAEAVVKESVEEAVETAVKETGEELIEATAKETVEEVAEELAEIAVKESADEVAQTVLKVTGEELAQGATKEVAEKTTEEVTENVVTHVVGDAVAVAPVASIKNASQTVAEEAIEETLEQAGEETTQRVLTDVVEGEVTKLPSDIADGLTEDGARELAEELSTELGGKKVWVSAGNGMVYVSASTDEALTASKMLKDAVTSSDTEKIEELVKMIANGSTRGSGDRVVLGAWEEAGGYIGDAVDNGGVFFDTGNDVWIYVKNSDIDPWLVNERFLQDQLESGVKRLDFMGEDIFAVINSPDLKVRTSYRAKEINWLLENAEKYGYTQIGNSWVLP
jgi:hypothetical protein